MKTSQASPNNLDVQIKDGKKITNIPAFLASIT
jgi:hypothetical protein